MVEVKNSLLPVLEQIEKQHKLTKEETIKLIEDAITSSANKFFNSRCKIVTKLDIDTGESRTYILKKVVDKVKDDINEISLSEAKEKFPDSKINDEVKILVNNESFTRIAAQTAKRIIIQKIRESDKKSVMEEFESQIGKIVPATIYNIKGKTIIVDLGKAEGLMPQREQVFKEKFKIGQHLKVLVKKVEKNKKGITVIVSRFDKDFIKKLFESEIPEIKDGIVEIINIVRAAGYRTKIAVRSHNSKVDPVGACVGMRGTRIKPIIDELQGERIDLIPYSEDIAKYIGYSLSPVKPEKVKIIDDKTKVAKVFVSQKVYDSVVTKNNINLNLAKELTGWNITLEPLKTTEEQNKEPEKESTPPVKKTDEKDSIIEKDEDKK